MVATMSLEELDAQIALVLKRRDAVWNPDDRREYQRLSLEHANLVKERWAIVNQWGTRSKKDCRGLNGRGAITGLREEPEGSHLAYCIHCGETVWIGDLSR